MTENPAPYGIIPHSGPSNGSYRDHESSLYRVFKATGCRTQAELAAFLGIRQSSISDAKKRGAIPADWLVTLLRKNWVNPFWVLGGEGAMFLQPCELVTPAQPLQLRPPSDYATEELLMELLRRVLKKIE